MSLNKIVKPVLNSLEHNKSKNKSSNKPKSSKHKSAPSKGKQKKSKSVKIGGRPPDTKASRSQTARFIGENNKSFAAALSSAALDDSFADRGENHEDVGVVINPYPLAQYIAGIVYATASATDRQIETYTLTRVWLYYFQNINAIQDVSLSSWPRPLVELAYSLRPRKVGGINFVPIWEVKIRTCEQIIANNVAIEDSTGLQLLTSGPNQADTGGWMTGYANSMGVANDSEVSAWQSSHRDQLDLVNIIEGVKLDTGCASAFAWDTGGVKTYVGPSTLKDPYLVIKMGQQTGVPFYSDHSSSVGLETPIKRPYLAKLRLGTVAPSYAGYDGTPATYGVRSPNYATVVKTPPAMLGVRALMGGMGRDPQFKLIPSRAILQEIINRIEQAGIGTVSALDGTAWYAKIALQDLVIYSYGLMKRQLRRYAGCEMGTYILTGSATTVNSAEPTYLHTDDMSYEMVRVPESVARVIGSFSAYLDEQGALIPLSIFQDISDVTTITANPVTRAPASYTGLSPYGSIPAVLPNQRFGIANAALNFKFKQFEKPMAAVCNMRPASQPGPTLLDVSAIFNSNNTTLFGLAARRPLGGPFLNRVMSSVAYLSYFNTAIGNTGAQDPSSGQDYRMTWQSVINHSYRQKYRRDTSGNDTIAQLRQIAWLDGFVPAGTLSSNMSGNDGPDTGANGLDPVVGATPLAPPILGGTLHSMVEGGAPDDRGVIQRIRDYLVPTYGNYCGPGYSAGERGGGQLMKDGKFLVKPIDALDALCKAHDEEIVRAGSDAHKIRKAHSRLYEGITDLPEKGAYGSAAQAVFHALLNLKDGL